MSDGRTRLKGVGFVLVGIILGATLIRPAVAHVGGTVAHLWTEHIRPKADARYANAVVGTDKAKDADKVDGLDSTQITPAGGDGRTAELALTSSNEPVLVATVTTPTAAALVTSASLDFSADGGGNDLVTCRLRFDSGVASSPSFSTAIPDTLFEPDIGSLSVDWVAVVEAGTHTVDLLCSALGTVTVDDAGLTVSAHR